MSDEVQNDEVQNPDWLEEFNAVRKARIEKIQHSVEEVLGEGDLLITETEYLVVTSGEVYCYSDGSYELSPDGKVKPWVRFSDSFRNVFNVSDYK